jgi:hypothetical protein
MSITAKSASSSTSVTSTTDVFRGVTNTILSSAAKNKKGISVQCCAAVKHSTKEKSFTDLTRGTPVYLRKNLTHGKINVYTSYAQCSKSPTKEGCTMCHIHSEMDVSKLVRMDELGDAERATPHHEYYGDMGVRGAKSTKKDPIKAFPAIPEPTFSLPLFITKVMSSGNKQLNQILPNDNRNSLLFVFLGCT